MKKKIIGIFVCMLLIMTSVLTINGSETKTSLIAEEKDCNCTIITYNMSFFPPPVMTEIPEFNIIEENTQSITVIDTPEYFSWMDYEGQDWTTPARNQGKCGSCWVFNALGALESVINIREGLADLDPDLSEQYVLSCLPNAGGCRGGYTSMAFRYIISNRSSGNNCNGIIPEECFPYKSIDINGYNAYEKNHVPVLCDEKCDNWEEYLIPVLEYNTISTSQKEVIKSTIMQKGPICAGMYVNWNFDAWIFSHHSPDDYYPYELVTTTNHAIIIVGWKDDPSIDMGGYWICKNSWGSLIGYNGFFNLEYDSLGINIEPMIWVDYDPSSYDWHPTPKAYGPYYGLINQPLQFKGEASGENPLFTWLWDFGDGATSEQQNPTHTYLSAGDYKVTLTVTDANNKSFYTTTSAWIQETNQPPQKPIIEGTRIIGLGKYCWCNFTVNDPDGSSIFLYWDMWNIHPDFWDGPYPSNEKVPGLYYWNESGVFTVRMKAKDPYGLESDWATFKVIVINSKTISTSFFLQRFFQHFPFFEKILNQIL